MMTLNESQKLEVASWVSQGIKLGEIQKLLDSEFDMSMTYLDVRFMIDDLNLEIKPQPKPKVEKETPDIKVGESSEVDTGSPSENTGNVTVTLHRINKPGAAISGQVSFSDGVNAEWALDQSGRLMLNAEQDGYQPVEEDLRKFQEKLSVLLKDQGY